MWHIMYLCAHSCCRSRSIFLRRRAGLIMCSHWTHGLSIVRYIGCSLCVVRVPARDVSTPTSVAPSIILVHLSVGLVTLAVDTTLPTSAERLRGMGIGLFEAHAHWFHVFRHGFNYCARRIALRNQCNVHILIYRREDFDGMFWLFNCWVPFLTLVGRQFR